MCRRQRRNQVCFFDLSDSEYPVAFNLFADVHPDDRELLAEGIVSAMYTIWGDSWGPQLERILRNSLIVLLDSPGTSFLHIPRFLTDPEFRARAVKRAKNPVARAFFEGQFASWPHDFIETSISPVLNKVEAFAVNQKIRNVLGQERSKLHFEHALAPRPHRHRQAGQGIGRRQAGVPDGLASAGARARRDHGARARSQ